MRRNADGNVVGKEYGLTPRTIKELTGWFGTTYYGSKFSVDLGRKTTRFLREVSTL